MIVEWLCTWCERMGLAHHEPASIEPEIALALRVNRDHGSVSPTCDRAHILLHHHEIARA